MKKQWGNPERFYSAIPPGLRYVLLYGGSWFNSKALAVLKHKL